MTVNAAIRECVTLIGDPLLEHIEKHCATYGFTILQVCDEVRAMVQRKELRMKDDAIDHDWTYRRGSVWEPTP